MAFTDYIGRTGAAAELPEQLAADLIGAVQKESVVLTMGHQVPTTTRDSRIPVVSSLPTASWISGVDPDVGLKSVTSMNILNESLVAEELAAIAVIPQNVVDDSEYDLWAAVKPELAKAIARSYDQAVMFGLNAPTTFPPGLVAAATTAGNVISGDTFANATDNASSCWRPPRWWRLSGFNVNRAAVSPGLAVPALRRRGLTALSNNPVGGDMFPLLLAGMPIRVNPLWWPAPVTGGPDAIVADWNMVIVGMRKDITLEPFREGIISDATGKVIQNLMQEDKMAVRATFRAGYYLATPPTGYVAATPCPVGIVKNTGTVFGPHIAATGADADDDDRARRGSSRK